MKKRNIAPILAGLLVTLMAGVLIAHAAEINYAPLAPLPIGDAGAIPPAYTLSSYLSGMIKLLIALGAATAILFAIIGGTQYVAAGIAPSAKTDAKNRIMNAFIGLTIMLTSYLLLNSINPDLVNFNLELKQRVITSTPISEIKDWGSDALIRQELAAEGITFNKDNCESVSQTTCTSMWGMPRQAIDGLISIKKECSGWFNMYDCKIEITGGTETGHQTHGIGIPNVDMDSTNSTLNTFIKSKKRSEDPVGTKEKPAPCGVGSADHYFLLNVSYTGIYVLEPAKNGQPEHWHVCFS